MSLRRSIYAIIMLSVALPMVFVAPFHHHEYESREDIRCDACTQHEPHPGHLTPKSGSDECLVCQLLAQQFYPPAGLDVNLFSSELTMDFGRFSDSVVSFFTHHSSPRAPPASFCF